MAPDGSGAHYATPPRVDKHDQVLLSSSIGFRASIRLRPGVSTTRLALPLRFPQRGLRRDAVDDERPSE